MGNDSGARQRKTVNQAEAAKGRLYHLDAARVLAIALVTLYHIWKRMGKPVWHLGGLSVYGIPEWGNVGVLMLLVLSGYLMVNSYRRLDGLPWGKKLRVFYSGRFWRIAPAYYFAILFWCLCKDGIGRKDILVHLLFIHNSFDAYEYGISGVFWYLSVQMGLYLAVPFLFFIWRKCCAVFHLTGARRIWAELGVCAVFFLNGVVMYLNDMCKYHSIFFMAPYFLLGMALYNMQEVWGIRTKYLQILGVILICGGFALMLMPQSAAVPALYRGSIGLLLGSGMVLFSIYPIPEVFREPLACLSTAAYSAYLYNYVMNYLNGIRHLGDRQHVWMWMLFYMTMVLAYGLFMYQVVERPLQKIVSKARRK